MCGESFFEAARAGCRKSAPLLKIINVLYRIEGDTVALSPAERAALRQKRSVRVLRGLRRRMDAIFRDERPRSPAARACLYTLGQWDGLQTYLTHGEVPIDNNGVEPERSADRLPQAARRASEASQNAIRPCALGKENYLFIGDVGAGERSAIFYSLLGSCLRRGINPREYLHWLFTRLPVTYPQDHATLTPAAYAAMHQREVPASAQAA